ncbi:hypothetical protein, partial [Actinoplanes lobatus]
MTSTRRRAITLLTAAAMAVVASVLPAGPVLAAADDTAFWPAPEPCRTTIWSQVNTKKNRIEWQSTAASDRHRFGDHEYQAQFRGFGHFVSDGIPRKWMDACAGVPVQQVIVWDKLTTLGSLNGEIALFQTSTVVHRSGQPWREIRGSINDKWRKLSWTAP